MRAGLVSEPAKIGWVDVPSPGEEDLAVGEVLIRPHIGGICGSDLPYFTRAQTFDGAPPPPGAPLHEIVGTVVSSSDPSLTAGDLVVGWAGNNDGLADLVRTAGSDVAKFEGIDLTDAVIAQPLACAFAVMERLTTPLRGAHIAVLGLGPIGLLFTDLARHFGAGRVTGVDPTLRYGRLERFGVDDYVQDTAENWATSLSDEARPEVVIEVVGHQDTTLNAAITAVAPWGEVFYFGVPETTPYEISMAAMLRKHLTLQSGTTAKDRRRHLNSALEHLRRQPELARALITDVFPVDEIQQAYTRAASQAPGQGKVVLRFPSGAD